MTDDCIYARYTSTSYYDPPEFWCKLGHDDNCGEKCPYRFSRENYEDELREDWEDDYAEYKHELYKDLFDF